MKHLKRFNEELNWAGQIENSIEAKKLLSQIYDIKDELSLGSFDEFLVDVDSFLNYADKHNGYFADDRFDNISESIDTIREYINDILLPLKDDGFEIKIQDTGTSTTFFIGNNPNGYITQSEIKVVEHLYNYLTEMGYKPYGKNILDDLDINFEVFSKNFKNLKNTKTMMYKRFIHFLENTDSKVNWIKFSFWNAKN